jgi:multidrug efflux system outer membrane protein
MYMSKPVNYILSLLLLAIALASCKVTKTYVPPNVQYKDSFRGSDNSDTTSIATLPWREVFTDTILQKLIAKGISENLDLQIAYTRIRQAQAYYEQSHKAFLPDLNANADITRSRLSDAQGGNVRRNITQYNLGVSSLWEADIWGRLKSIKKASLANFLQTQAGMKVVQSSVVKGIATLYFELMALDRQLAITEMTVKNWDTLVTTMRYLKEAARVTEAAVVQSEAQKYAAEVTIPDLKQRIRETENALSILLGVEPSAIDRSLLEDQSPLRILNTGIPAQLLANRPDVQEAEFGYRNAFELTNVARTAFYPSLRITGSGGLSSISLSNFLNSTSLFASITGGLTQPIFNRRLNKTNLEVAQQQQQASLLNFKNTLLIASQEVSDALSLHDASMRKMIIRSNEIIALQRSVEYTQELLQNGFANYTEVITARQNLLSAQLGSINDQLQQLESIVNLYVALGGGSR